MKKDYSQYFRKPSLKEASERKKEIIIDKEGLHVPVDMKNVGKDKLYFIRTYGCQGNEADSEVIAGILEFLGYKKADVVEKARNLKPSARGELEITDLNNLYLKEKRMNVVPMRRGNAWLDAGTPDSLMESGAFVRIIEQRQGLKIACIEEIAYRRKFINDAQMLKLITHFKDGNYKKYLQKIYEEYHELY